MNGLLCIQAVSALAEARRGKRTLAEANEADTLEPDGEENTKESVAEAKLKFLKVCRLGYILFTYLVSGLHTSRMLPFQVLTFYVLRIPDSTIRAR